MNRPEQALQRTIVAGLRVCLPQEWFILHYPAGGYRRPVEAAILKAMGVVPGVPDLMILGWSDGGNPTAWFLEVKAGNGRLTPTQRDCNERLRTLGFPVAVVRSWPEVLTACKQWRLPLRLAEPADVHS